MSRRNRHAQYRNRIYRKRNIRTTVITTTIVLCAVFVLFLIWGNALHKAVSSTPVSTEATGTPREPSRLATTEAYAVPLLQDGSTFSARLAALPDEATAVCIDLNTPDGTLNFRSSLTSELSHLTTAADAVPISSAVSAAERYDLHLSAVIYTPAFASSRESMSDIDLAVVGTLCREVLSAGVSDVLIISRFATSANLSKLCAFADNIKADLPDAAIGFTLSNALLSSASASDVDTLNRHFAFLALDTTEFGEESPDAYIESKVSGKQIDLLFYKMRVLLPAASDAATSATYIEIVKKYNIPSWQILPR